MSVTRVLAVLALLAGVAATDAGATVLDEPGARIFALAGGGTAKPVGGAPGTRVRLAGGYTRDPALVALADGSVVTNVGGDLFALSREGTARTLPSLDVAAIASDVDGSLVAFRRGEFGGRPAAIVRLAEDDRSWATVVNVGPLPGPSTCGDFDMTATPEGFVIGDGASLHLVGRDGAVSRLPLPPGIRIGPIAALPDGSVAYARKPGRGCEAGWNADEIGVLGRDGSTRVVARLGRGIRSIAAHGADHLLAVTHQRLTAVPVRGGASVAIGARSGPGTGDGGHPGAAMLRAPEAVTTASDGAIVVTDEVPDAEKPGQAAFEAYEDEQGVLRRQSGDGVSGLRVIVPPDSRRGLLAIRDETLVTARRGDLAYRSTVAGDATLTIRRPGRADLRVSGHVVPGDGLLRFPKAAARGPVAFELAVRTAAGPELVARARAYLADVLGIAEARRAAAAIARRYAGDGDGSVASGYEVGACRRGTERSVVCQAVRYLVRDHGGDDVFTKRTCRGLFTIHLRPDGLAVVPTGGVAGWTRRARRACERIRPIPRGFVRAG